MEHLFDSICKELSQPLGRRKAVSLLGRAIGLPWLASLGLQAATGACTANGSGPCTTGDAGTVCCSAVCDADNKCGYLNGDGPCTVNNGGTVCRSGVCDSDNKCGYLNGDGPCTAGNAGAVCRSGICDSDNKCGYLNGDGPCTVNNGGTVCRSGVCDSDGKCGYATGDGPCTSLNAGTVCRSGACSANGTCEPAGGCDVDADCTAGNWCNETSHTCRPKSANGAAIPSDAVHTNPTLNGTCTAAAAALVCLSGVCDVDNKCGYANGDGPCTVNNGGTVCRSGVCDTDNKCGYLNGDGPCTGSNGPVVCRSGSCSTNGTCEAAGGCNVSGDCSTGQGCCNQTCTPLGTNQNCASCGNVCSSPFTCVSSGSAGTCMQNNSAGVRVNTSGWLFSRVSQRFSGTLTVTNIGASSINAPMMVVLGSLSAGVTLQNGSGTFAGSPYIVVQSSGTLGPGSSATVALQFSDPQKAAISFSPATYTN